MMVVIGKRIDFFSFVKQDEKTQELTEKSNDFNFKMNQIGNTLKLDDDDPEFILYCFIFSGRSTGTTNQKQKLKKT